MKKTSMKIKLKCDLPIENYISHGCIEGAIFDVTGVSEGRDKIYFFKGKLGKKCGAYSPEFEVLNPNQ